MKINYIQENLRKITYEEDLPEYMTEKHAEDIAEVFHTPLQGTYNWDYRIQDNRIKRLYELGKELNWNVEMEYYLQIECGRITGKENLNNVRYKPILTK